MKYVILILVVLISEPLRVFAEEMDSYVYEATFFSDYKFVVNQRYLLTPELKLNQIRYHDRSDKQIYANDEYNIAPALRLAYEHKLLYRMGSFLLDYEHKYTARNIYQTKEKHMAARSNVFILGEKLKIFDFGDTTLKYKMKQYRSYDEQLHNNTNSITLSQVGILPRNHILLFFFQRDIIDTYNNTSENTASNLYRFDYIFPEIFPTINLNLAFSLTALTYDDATKSEQNGVEKTYNPSIKFTKKASDNLSLSIDYSYTKTTSLNESNAYTKHVTTTELKYTF